MSNRIITFVFFIVFLPFGAYATHIIGGDVVYRCTSVNEVEKTTTFAVSFTLYRDAIGGIANYDLNAQFGVYGNSPGSPNWFFVQSVTSNPTNIGNVALNDPCVTVPPNIRIERGSYHFSVTLPWDGNTYQISYQRCCRNNTIDNISNPGSAGAVFSIEISGDAIRNCNNSPSFKKFPPIIVCNNRPLHFDHGINDMEGDSVIYEFCTPLTSGGMLPGDDCLSVAPSPFKCPPPYDIVTFVAPYQSNAPMQGNPTVSINPHTGLITGTPNITGQYVVGICIKEYRDGVLLTTTRRDFQFNVLNCAGITFNQEYSICENDTLTINDSLYTEAGTYTQNFITASGCDSIVVIKITEKLTSTKNLSASLCEGAAYNFFGELLRSSGTYTKVLTGMNGCDSTIILDLMVNQPSELTLNYSICDDEFLEINGEVYNTSGTFKQLFTNEAGCDSTLTIIVKKGFSFRDTNHVYLCILPSYTINGITYNSPGEYQQSWQTDSGCDSILHIKVYPCDQNVLYDFETCNALTPEQSMNYSEFTPNYVKVLSCGGINASNIHREFPQENKHSCTQGQASNLAMCVGASTACDLTQATSKPVVLTFIANPEEGSYIKWNHLIFYHNSPAQYSWINGASGPNNYPTKFRYIIYKNGHSIFINNNQLTGNMWGKHQLNFLETTDMRLERGDTIRIEWLPYCAVGNNAPVSVWDLDNISLYFSCETKNNRIIAGRVTSALPVQGQEAEIRRYEGVKVVPVKVSGGKFSFSNNNPYSSYDFIGFKNDLNTEGVSTLDLVLIQKHILGISPFDNPMQFIAADINNDKRINTIDVIELRKIILGIQEKFPNNHSWRLIPVSETKTLSHPLFWQDKVHVVPGYRDIDSLDFIPIKIGDVSGCPKPGQEVIPD